MSSALRLGIFSRNNIYGRTYDTLSVEFFKDRIQPKCFCFFFHTSGNKFQFIQARFEPVSLDSRVINRATLYRPQPLRRHDHGLSTSAIHTFIQIYFQLFKIRGGSSGVDNKILEDMLKMTFQENKIYVYSDLKDIDFTFFIGFTEYFI